MREQREGQDDFEVFCAWVQKMEVERSRATGEKAFAFPEGVLRWAFNKPKLAFPPDAHRKLLSMAREIEAEKAEFRVRHAALIASGAKNAAARLEADFVADFGEPFSAS